MKVFYLILCSTLLASCKCYNYVGSPKFVPLNTEGGTTTINLYPSNLQLGYSFTNHLGAFASVHGRTAWQGNGFLGGKEGGGDTTRHSGDRLLDLGFVYSRSYKRLIVEMIAGGGFGKSWYHSEVDLYRDGYDFKYASRTRNMFIQPNVGLRYDDFSIAVFSKFTRWQFYSIDTDINRNASYLLPEDTYFFNAETVGATFMEPGIQVRTGNKKAEFIAQLSNVIGLSSTHLVARKVNLNIGCVFIVGRSD